MSYKLDYSDQVRLGYLDPEERETASKVINLTEDEKHKILAWNWNSEFNKELFLRLSKKGLIYDTGNCYELTDIGEYILDHLEEDESCEVFDIVFELEEEQNKDNIVSANQVLRFLKESGLGESKIWPESMTFDLPRGFIPFELTQKFECSPDKIREILAQLYNDHKIDCTGVTKRKKFCIPELKEQAKQNLLKEQEMRAKAYEERKNRSKFESQT